MAFTSFRDTLERMRNDLASGNWRVKSYDIDGMQRDFFSPAEFLQMLYDVERKAADGNALDGGIEYEEATGRIAAYWFDDGAFTRRVVRVPAAQVIHGFEALRPGQLHGISPFVACVMVAGDLAELLDSELDATRLQSKYLGFVQSNDPVGFQADRKAAGRRAEHLSNATLEYLRAGDSVTLAQINRQSGTFEPFLRFNLRTLAVGTGLTYELLTGCLLYTSDAADE